MRRPFLITAVATTVAVVACGLDAVDDHGLHVDDDPVTGDASVSPPSSSDASATSKDAGGGKDAGGTNEPCTTTSTACSAPLAKDGWTPVFVPVDPAHACPDGYGAIDLVTDPVAAPGACSCGSPVLVEEPSCDVKKNYGGNVGDSTCDKTSAKLDVQGGGCTSVGNGNADSVLAKYGRYTPIQPANKDTGKCEIETTKDATKVGASNLRICRPAPACVEDVCNGQSTSELRSCVTHEGEATCPAAFPHAMQAGTAAALSCSACACAVEGSCGVATLEFFEDAQCATSIGTRKVNGKCEAIDGSVQESKSPKAFKYTAHPNFHAALDGPSVATVTLSSQGLNTICCR